MLRCVLAMSPRQAMPQGGHGRDHACNVPPHSTEFASGLANAALPWHCLQMWPGQALPGRDGLRHGDLHALCALSKSGAQLCLLLSLPV
jgi:hypothetical protein